MSSSPSQSECSYSIFHQNASGSLSDSESISESELEDELDNYNDQFWNWAHELADQSESNSGKEDSDVDSLESDGGEWDNSPNHFPLPKWSSFHI